ncbi:spherulin-1B precursor [Mycena metata]|uniref:Spherulin-1B n=1 Tax=Mycena metata TaxID=1033252 RepID=A0AAD7K440_9AGAR|nr:spherulin-1B precursor [Mycena metata]
MFKASLIIIVLAASHYAHAAPAPWANVSSSAPASIPTHGTAVAASPTVPSPAPVPMITNGTAIAASLKTSPSVADRFNELLTDGNGTLLTGEALRELTVFDFNNQSPAPGAKGGSILLATIDNFPILEALGISGAVSIFEPCGLNIPHLHPRASELLTVIEGVLDTGFVQELGFNAEVATQLGKLQATVFPMGSMHYQQNPTCKPAIFVAALNNEDPGRSDIATSFWSLPADVIDAALGFPETIGGDNIEAWRAHLPVNLAAGVDSCLKMCGLSK